MPPKPENASWKTPQKSMLLNCNDVLLFRFRLRFWKSFGSGSNFGKVSGPVQTLPKFRFRFRFRIQIRNHSQTIFSSFSDKIFFTKSYLALFFWKLSTDFLFVDFFGFCIPFYVESESKSIRVRIRHKNRKSVRFRFCSGKKLRF